MIATPLLLVAAIVTQDSLTPEGRQLRADVQYLAADAREGRGVGTQGLIDAGAYVAAAFQKAGLTPAGTDGYFQPFTISPTAPGVMHTDLGGKSVRNVVAVLPGRSSARRGEIVVIGAHYDHLGLGGPFALDHPDSTGKIHNGADDNASGTTALMDVARLLRDRRLDRTVVFIAFSAEEEGDLGSEYYVSHPTVGVVDSIYAMLNMDMVGRLRNAKLIVAGASTAKEFPAILDSLNATHCPASAIATSCAQFDLRASGDGWSPSDNASFFAAKRPVLHFFTDLHEDYHRTTDDWEKINVPGMVQVAHYVADVATAVANRPGPLTFVDAPPPKQTASGSGYGAYLGTIPDMSESPGGVRITGVRAGSPAQTGGLQGGDVITKMGDQVVANLYDMTDVLRAHHPGDTLVIVVQRNGAAVPLTVVLGKRE